MCIAHATRTTEHVSEPCKNKYQNYCEFLNLSLQRVVWLFIINTRVCSALRFSSMLIVMIDLAWDELLSLHVSRSVYFSHDKHPISLPWSARRQLYLLWHLWFIFVSWTQTMYLSAINSDRRNRFKIYIENKFTPPICEIEFSFY